MKQIKAFTLLECLLALFIMSLSVLVISGLSKLIVRQIQLAQADSTQNWDIFCEQLRHEFADEKLVKVEHNFLFVSADRNSQSLRYGFVSGDFRKTDAKGRGYQPMLYELTGAKISQQDEIVKISVDFQNGGERTFCYKFSKASQ